MTLYVKTTSASLPKKKKVLRQICNAVARGRPSTDKSSGKLGSEELKNMKDTQKTRVELQSHRGLSGP